MGHRKPLAVFLVDLHIPMLSTANLPPQRRDWWTDEVRKVGPLAKLPKELFDIVIESLRNFRCRSTRQVRFGRGDGGEPWMRYTLNYGLNLTEFIDERRREANLSTSRISFLFASTECVERAYG
jgi:hypothetical protein